MLLKVALILGCDFVDNVEFKEICPLSIKSQTNGTGATNAQENEPPAECCCDSHRNDSDDDRIGAFVSYFFCDPIYKRSINLEDLEPY